MAPRDNLRSERVRPSIGARMPVNDRNDEFEKFAIGLDNSVRDILGVDQVYDQVRHQSVGPGAGSELQQDALTDSQPEAENQVRGRSPYKIYESDDMRMTLAERRWGDKRPNRRATYWSPSDKGRIIGEIKDEIDRLPLDEVMDDDGSLKIVFDSVKRVGGQNKSDRKHGRKLALVPEDGPGYELLCGMHEAVVEIFDRHHKGYKYPDDFIPHVTFGRVYRSVEEPQVGRIVEAAGRLLPVEVNLGPIEFYDTQQISIR